MCIYMTKKKVNAEAGVWSRNVWANKTSECGRQRRPIYFPLPAARPARWVKLTRFKRCPREGHADIVCAASELGDVQRR